MNTNKKPYRISISKQKFTPLWTDSSCSLSFPPSKTVISRTERFQHNSIYHNNHPTKYEIDKYQKPELLLTQFRKSIRQAVLHINHNNTNKQITNKKKIKQKQYQRISPQHFSHKVQQIIQRLSVSHPKILKLQYDRFGNRSHFYTNEPITNIHNKTVKKKKYKNIDLHFTCSTRIDMAKPENFNPGPGTYFNNLSSQRKIITMKTEITNKDIGNQDNQCNKKNNYDIEKIDIVETIKLDQVLPDVSVLDQTALQFCDGIIEQLQQLQNQQL